MLRREAILCNRYYDYVKSPFYMNLGIVNYYNEIALDDYSKLCTF